MAYFYGASKKWGAIGPIRSPRIQSSWDEGPGFFLVGTPRKPQNKWLNPSMVGMLVPLKGGIGSIFHPPGSAIYISGI